MFLARDVAGLFAKFRRPQESSGELRKAPGRLRRASESSGEVRRTPDSSGELRKAPESSGDLWR
eukprot:9220149-Alexandrium_andersonii.AAC.1